MSEADLVIRNGRIIDPANELDFYGDLAVKDGWIISIGQNLQIKASQEFNAAGCLVTPGLIDCHVHCYEFATPLGINPDEQCLRRGVTTIVDAGSAGASTFKGLRKFIAEKSRTRVLCFLHITNFGLASAGCASGAPGGELDSLNAVSTQDCVECIKKNRDMIVGVKVRLTEFIADKGKNEKEAYRRALDASKTCNVPLMVHHTISTVPIQVSSSDDPSVLGCPRDLRPGDLYTHTYHAYKSSIVDPATGSIYQDVVDAKSRGILFDVGHGQGSFGWTVADICAKQNFWPDTISTDMHTGNFLGPVYDLTTVMSKFLHLGMSLNDVIKAVTITPAKAIGWADRIGSLSVGKEADITVMKLSDDVTMEIEDSQSQVRKLKTIIKPVAVWRRGVKAEISNPSPFPNVEAMKLNACEWENLEVRDAAPPATYSSKS